MPTQHAATLLGATCCVRLATLLRHVATLKFENGQHVLAKRTQHGAQQCWDMLRWHVAIV